MLMDIIHINKISLESSLTLEHKGIQSSRIAAFWVMQKRAILVGGGVFSSGPSQDSRTGSAVEGWPEEKSCSLSEPLCIGLLDWQMRGIDLKDLQVSFNPNLCDSKSLPLSDAVLPARAVWSSTGICRVMFARFKVKKTVSKHVVQWFEELVLTFWAFTIPFKNRSFNYYGISL